MDAENVPSLLVAKRPIVTLCVSAPISVATTIFVDENESKIGIKLDKDIYGKEDDINRIVGRNALKFTSEGPETRPMTIELCDRINRAIATGDLSLSGDQNEKFVVCLEGDPSILEQLNDSNARVLYLKPEFFAPGVDWDVYIDSLSTN